MKNEKRLKTKGKWCNKRAANIAMKRMDFKTVGGLAVFIEVRKTSWKFLRNPKNRIPISRFGLRGHSISLSASGRCSCLCWR
jgi:hypothetical protein